MRLLYYIILFTPLISYIDNLIGRGTLQYLMFVVPTYVILEKKLYKNILVILTYLLFSVQFSINIIDHNNNFNYITLVRWAGFMLILILCSHKSIIGNFLDFIKERYNLIKSLSIFYLLIQTYYFFFGGFTYNWDGKYFVSFYVKNSNFGGGAAHTNSYLLIIIQLMLMCVVYQEMRKKKLINIVLYSFATLLAVYFNLLTGARTSSVIALFILVCYILKIAYNNREILKKHIKLITTIIIGAIVILLLLISFNVINLENIPLVQKFIRQINNGNFMSSRDRIWPALFNEFCTEYSPIQMLFGKYFGVTTIINEQAIGEAIWAHNDFIEVLLSVGLVGVGIYIGTLIKILMNYRNHVLLISLVLIASFNGLMNYPILAMSVPLLISIYCLLQEVNYNDIASDYKQTNVDLKNIIQKLVRKK